MDNPNIYNVEGDNRLSPSLQSLTTGSGLKIWGIFLSSSVIVYYHSEKYFIVFYRTKHSSFKHLKSSFGIIKQLLSTYEVNVKLSTFEKLLSLVLKPFRENNHFLVDNLRCSPHTKAIIVYYLPYDKIQAR